jgi:FtsP/CotA-like multicopper oxidase with cupredoxin domain
MAMKNGITQIARILMLTFVVTSLAAVAHASVPGITASTGSSGSTFDLIAQDGYLNQPDGAALYSWGYGCNGSPVFAKTLGGATFAGQGCTMMQVPAPTLIVNEGAQITVTLTNGLPAAAGNTSILFPGFLVTAAAATTQPAGCTAKTPAPAGLLTTEAAPGCAVTYTFTALAPGTHPYYSGTQGDLQIEMGLYGAVIVLPKTPPANCTGGIHAANQTAKAYWGEADWRLSSAAYDHPASCYDREYLFQWAEADARIHKQAQAQSTLACTACMDVQTEPYHPSYFLINGRSMPDLMDPNYAGEYPSQPYNANPHTHPGEMLLIRTIGQGRWQHPFHEHANHVRILARDGNLELAGPGGANCTSSAVPTCINYIGGGALTAPALSGLLMFNTDTTPGESFDGIFYFTGRGLNWDPYGHHPNDAVDPSASLSCTPDAYGYNTGFGSTDTNYANGVVNPGAVTAINFYEWCQDHNKPVQVNPFGDVPAGGPATFPDPDILTNGAWYGGTPYLGPDASLRAAMPACVGGSNPTSPVGSGTVNTANCTTLQPANLQLNPQNERGWAFMWHSHNEREITTNNVFPGGMLMMLLVDTREFSIDESR